MEAAARSTPSGAPGAGRRESLLDALNWLNEDCTASISSVRAPIISINSDLQRTDIEAFRKHAPSFEAKTIPGTGHLLMWDVPDQFDRLLEESVREFRNESARH